ncbi:hypothetical protein BH11PLA1_BH11PLA1_14060 [soil metagenome]
MIRPMFALAAVAGSMIFVVGLGGCETNAATGRSQLQYFSRDQEIALGVQSMPEMVQEFGGKVADPALQAYVTNIGRQLASVTEGENPSLPWEFTFLNSDVINAFALPGGKVFVTRGLVKQMTNEAQLAHVMGHEVGHVTARHQNDRASRSAGAEVLAGLAGAAAESDLVAQIAGQGAGLWLLKYSREQESEADALGMRYMAKINYDPAAAIEVMDILIKASAGGKQPEILATHPDPELRKQHVTSLVQTDFKSTQNNPKYQKYADRFRGAMLAKLAALPPAEGAVGIDGRSIVLSDPTTWCAHCAAAAAAERAAQQ